jgi:putative ABC transport system permease protein
MGLDEQPRLYRVLDRREREVTIAREGLSISQKLAELLGASVGDEIVVEFQEGRRSRHRVPIRKVFTDYTEPGAYIHREALHRLLQEGECLSGAFVSVDPLHLDDLLRSLKTISTVTGVTMKEAAMKSFEETIAENLRPMRVINAVFASIIAFGVIFNCALIALAERSRDLATLRVMGFTRREVYMVLLGELAVITLTAIPVGLPIGYGFSYLATLALDTETHRFPLVVEQATFAYASFVILSAAFISASVVRRMIDRLDLIAVLKVKE